MYTTDNDDKFYQAWYNANPYDHRWMDCVKRYYQNPKICFCPQAVIPVHNDNSPVIEGSIDTSNVVARKTSDAWGRFLATDTRPGYAGMAGSYGINDWVADPTAIPASSTSSKGVAKIGTNDMYWIRSTQKGLDQVPIFLDARWLGGFPGQNTILGGTDNPDQVPDTEETIIAGDVGMMSRYTINRHGGYSDAVFMDFSTKKVGIKELWNLKWHQKYNTKNKQTKKAAAWKSWMNNFTNFYTD